MNEQALRKLEFDAHMGAFTMALVGLIPIAAGACNVAAHPILGAFLLALGAVLIFPGAALALYGAFRGVRFVYVFLAEFICDRS